jgi:hypothetical protein
MFDLWFHVVGASALAHPEKSKPKIDIEKWIKKPIGPEILTGIFDFSKTV